MTQQNFTIRPLDESDQAWLPTFMVTHWGSTLMVSKGRIFDVVQNAGFIAEDGALIVGLVTYEFLPDGTCEITSLDSLREGEGIGTALISHVAQAAQAQGVARLWLITTNDNTHALRFYQRRGFKIVGFYPNALDYSRQLKPQIPLTGIDDIPLSDEFELEAIL